MARCREARAVCRLLLGQRRTQAEREFGRRLADRHIVLDEPARLDDQERPVGVVAFRMARVVVQHEARPRIKPAQAADPKVAPGACIPALYAPACAGAAAVGIGVSVRGRLIDRHRRIRNLLRLVPAVVRDVINRCERARRFKAGRGAFVIERAGFVPQALHCLHGRPVREPVHRLVVAGAVDEVGRLRVRQRRDLVDDHQRGLGGLAVTDRLVRPVAIPTFVFEQAVEEMQIRFALPAPRAHRWLAVQAEAESALQLRIAIEEIGDDLLRRLFEPAFVVTRAAQEHQRRRKFDLVRRQPTVPAQVAHPVHEAMYRTIDGIGKRSGGLLDPQRDGLVHQRQQRSVVAQ